RRPAATRHFHERVFARQLDVCAPALARHSARVRHCGRARRSAPAAQQHCLRRAARRYHAGAGFVCADVRPSRPGSARRHLSAAAAGRLVPERRQAAGVTMAITDRIDGTRVPEHRPCARIIVGDDVWHSAIRHVARGEWTLLGLWCDSAAVHMAMLEERLSEIAVVTIEAASGAFPSVAALHPPAIRLERAIQDLYGLRATALPDARPWLDLGCWDVMGPLGARPSPSEARLPYAFLPVEGENLHQIPVGPVHAGIIEPGHFRFTANGETIVRLEQRLGYVHKGIESLMSGASIERGARLAGRTSGDSTVAYALAFAHAVEAALELQVPPRAVY